MKNNLFFLLVFPFCSLLQAQTWSVTGQIGSGNEKVRCLASNGGSLYAGTDGAGLQVTSDKGSSWQSMNTGLTNTNVHAILIHGSNMYCGTIGGGVFISFNNGNSWTPVNSGLPELSIESLAANGSTIFAGTMQSGVFMSSDNGATWTDVNNGLTNPVMRSLFVSGNTLLAGTNGAMGVYYSNDNGTNWTSATGNLNNNYVLSFAKIGSTLLAGTGCCVLSSSDNGASWSAINTNLGASRYGFAVNGATVYGATHSTYGAYISTDAGATWTIIGSGLGNKDLFSIALHSGDLYVGTEGGGVWKLALSTGTTISTGMNELERNAAFSVFPNPSDGNLSVNSDEEMLHVSLITALGKTILSENVPENKSHTINIKDASPGVYFITVTSANATIMKKIIVQQ